MYRFKDKAITSADEPSFRPLFDFIDQFSIDVGNISTEKEFIRAVERALHFKDSIYTTSYAIKNHSGHYYGVFFITPNIFGLEKILDVKWQLDIDGGEEYSGSSQVDCFLETERKSMLESGLIKFLSKEVTNAELYEYILTMGFLPKHASAFLVDWEQSGKLTVTDTAKQKPARKRSFKIKYEEFKNKIPSRKLILQL